jgi:hypothetical protein
MSDKEELCVNVYYYSYYLIVEGYCVEAAISEKACSRCEMFLRRDN